MKYREFLSLTDEEVILIMKEIFPNALRVDNVMRDKKWNRISCDIYIMEEEPDFADEIEFDADGNMDTKDFMITQDEEFKLKQFLLAKGCDERLKDNPYLSKNTKRYMKCIYCGKKIYENEKCIRKKYFTGFYCSCQCLLLNEGFGYEDILTDELVQEDKECNECDWEIESEEI